jgi:hypothetical protein
VQRTGRGVRHDWEVWDRNNGRHELSADAPRPAFGSWTEGMVVEDTARARKGGKALGSRAVGRELHGRGDGSTIYPVSQRYGLADYTQLEVNVMRIHLRR